MSNFEYADQISVQGLTLQDADLAEEEAEMETIKNKYGEQVSLNGPVCSNCHQRINGLKGYILTASIERKVCMHCVAKVEAGNLVSLHYGHGGLAAGGRKRVEA